LTEPSDSLVFVGSFEIFKRVRSTHNSTAQKLILHVHHGTVILDVFSILTKNGRSEALSVFISAASFFCFATVRYSISAQIRFLDKNSTIVITFIMHFM